MFLVAGDVDIVVGVRGAYPKVIEPNHPNPDPQAVGKIRVSGHQMRTLGVKKNAPRSTWLLFTWVPGQYTRGARKCARQRLVIQGTQNPAAYSGSPSSQ